MIGAAALALAAWDALHPLPAPRRRLEIPDHELGVSLALAAAADFPAEAKLTADGRTARLQRTGAFTRRVSILFVGLDVYRIASYVENPRPAAAETVLEELLVDGPRRVLALRFLRTLSGAQLREAFDAEIKNCFGDVDLERQAGPLKRFLAEFAQGAGANEILYLAWLPGGRFFLGRNDPQRLAPIAADPAFARAVWRIWSAPTAGDSRYELVSEISLEP